MPVFRVTSPEGAAYDVTAPDDATEQDALAVAQAHHSALARLPSATSGSAVAGGAQIAAAASVPPGSDNYPRQAACTAAGYECVQDGFPSGACFDAEQKCNQLAHIFRAMPVYPPRTATTIFPNGSTVVAPSGYDPVRGAKVAPPGQPRAPR